MFFFKLAKDSAVGIEIGRSFHQLGAVQEKVRESDLTHVKSVSLPTESVSCALANLAVLMR